MSWLANLWHGMSPCMSPGVGDCVVWWEAWSVLVGVMVGVASIFIAALAWKTSGRAAAIAAEAKDIAQQQHIEAVQLREANARIIGFLLTHEICELPVNLFTLRESCKRVLQKGKPIAEADVDYLENVIRRGGASFLAGAEKSEGRLHTLPETLGNDVAVLIGYNRTLNAISADILQMVKVIERPNMHPPTLKVYSGSMSMIENFVKYIEMFSRISIPAAEQIREFVGQEPHDFSAVDLDKVDG